MTHRDSLGGAIGDGGTAFVLTWGWPPDGVKREVPVGCAWNVLRHGILDSGEELISLDIGQRLRAVRRAGKASLRSVARRTGFSASFLSQVELGQCSPSISSLQRICEALGTDLPDLLAPRAAKSAPVIRRSDREAFRSAWSKATAQSLATGRNLPYSALLVTIRPGGKTGELHAPGGHFFAYCMKGRLRVVLHDVPHELAAGDSITVEQPRAAWENTGRASAEILVVALR